ncbi:hypothetical protein [Agaribacterium haliotis]|uniref:hypothetical protein n=1 Tax=Agaribacterium haliotis TaxID=2013869 RepID=UPI000BB531F0|nr:hypothetical protein [Agaribacterium haliotis]
MTSKEAQCFRCLRRWQRIWIWQQFKQRLVPTPLFKQSLSQAGGLNKLLPLLMLILSSPLWLSWWLIRLFFFLLHLPWTLSLSLIRPPGLRAPGERNIKGLHYQFAPYISLPPELYIRCVDDWVCILYGADKLPKYSLSTYLDAEYLLHRRLGLKANKDLDRLILSQISNAREDLSRDLGHY